MMKNSFSGFDRPVRLSGSTRALADRALRGEFGKEMEMYRCCVIDDPDFDRMSPARQYTACVEAIAANIPLRLVDGEWLAGSATYDMARDHVLPAVLSQTPDTPLFKSLSHLTAGFDRVLLIGYDGLRREIASSRDTHSDDPGKLEFLNCLEICLNAADHWHTRYMDELANRINQTEGDIRARWEKVMNNLANVPARPPESFAEAVQSLWFQFAFLRACGNWPAIGRIDMMLEPLLKKDIELGKISKDEAREYIAHFWIKGCEWVTGDPGSGSPVGSGDGQNYQNIVLGGIDELDSDLTNMMTFLVLDVVEELGIADFPIAVRINKNSPEGLVNKIAKIMRFGGGTVAVYNDDIVVRALMNFGYTKKEACSYANDGCWEVQMPGKTAFRYYAWDVLALLQRNVLRLHEPGPSDLPYADFESLYKAFSIALHEVYKSEVVKFGQDSLNSKEPTPLMALFVEGCIANAADYFDGGPCYRVMSPHAGGLPDVASALEAIYQVVFVRKMMPLNTFLDIVKSNWEGQEELRLYVRKQLVYYGNDDPGGDAMMQRVFDEFLSAVGKVPEKNGILYPAGISTFGRQVRAEFLDWRTANPDGHKKGEYLAHNINPSPGSDTKGATALIRSSGRLGMDRLPGGTALTIRLTLAAIQGDDGIEALSDLIYGFCDSGGHFLQIDVSDNQLLVKAKAHPEEYAGLIVRVSGWSSRFATLSDEWKDLVIQATSQNL